MSATDRKCVAEYLDGCDGIITRHHLVPQQELKRRFPRGALLVGGHGALRLIRKEAARIEWHLAELQDDLELVRGARVSVAWRPLGAILRDRRNLVWICSRHHQLVEARSIHVPKKAMPRELQAFADELGMGWYLDVERLEPERLAS